MVLGAIAPPISPEVEECMERPQRRERLPDLRARCEAQNFRFEAPESPNAAERERREAPR
jgi:hypothetical protein